MRFVEVEKSESFGKRFYNVNMYLVYNSYYVYCKISNIKECFEYGLEIIFFSKIKN